MNVPKLGVKRNFDQFQESQDSFISHRDLESRFSSKADLYKYMVGPMNLYLPSIQGTKIAFLKAILSGEKDAIKRDQITNTFVPNYPELSVIKLYPEVMKDKLTASFLPNVPEHQPKMPEKEFFFGILSAIQPQYLEKIINDADHRRMREGDQEEKKESIEVSKKWAQELLLYDFIPKKKGTAVALLKKGSKAKREHKAQKQAFENVSLEAFEQKNSHFGDQLEQPLLKPVEKAEAEEFLRQEMPQFNI